MRIVTYNLNGRTHIREQWGKITTELNPDILLLQEVRSPEQWAEPSLYQSSEPRLYWTPMNSHWGTAIYAKGGQVRRIDLDGCRGWAVGLEIQQPAWFDAARSPLYTFSLHVANQPYFQTANKILDAIATYTASSNVIIGGDFNLTVGWQDSPREGLITDKESVQFLKRLQKQWGLMSAWQAAHPNQPLVQTLHLSNSAKKFHCDGIFFPAAWFRYLDSCEVCTGEGWENLSDHNPVVATFAG